MTCTEAPKSRCSCTSRLSLPASWQLRLSQTRTVSAGLEVVVEARDLEHLDHRQAHFGRQRHDVALEQGAVMVVEGVQVLDQEIAPMAFGRCRADQGAHLGARLVTGLAALEPAARLAQLFTHLAQTDAGFRHQ